MTAWKNVQMEANNYRGTRRIGRLNRLVFLTCTRRSTLLGLVILTLLYWRIVGMQHRHILHPRDIYAGIHSLSDLLYDDRSRWPSFLNNICSFADCHTAAVTVVDVRVIYKKKVVISVCMVVKLCVIVIEVC